MVIKNYIYMEVFSDILSGRFSSVLTVVTNGAHSKATTNGLSGHSGGRSGHTD